jgi:hypothetical protein
VTGPIVLLAVLSWRREQLGAYLAGLAGGTSFLTTIYVSWASSALELALSAATLIAWAGQCIVPVALLAALLALRGSALQPFQKSCATAHRLQPWDESNVRR